MVNIIIEEIIIKNFILQNEFMNTLLVPILMHNIYKFKYTQYFLPCKLQFSKVI